MVPSVARVGEVGLTMGSWPGAGGFGIGFHYAERGALLSTWIMAILGSAAEQQSAQARANATGQTQYYRSYSPSDFGRTGMTIDAYSSQFGGDMSGVLFDLFIVRRIKEDSELPWCIDFGLAFNYLDGPDTMITDPANPMNAPTLDEHQTVGLGFVIGLLAPVTKWAQAEIKARPVLGSSYLTYEAGGTVNNGNRVYARGAFGGDLAVRKGLLFGFGGRL